MATSLVLVGVAGFIDYATGRDLVISTFYLLPILWATWLLGRSAGLALSLLSTVLWLIGDDLLSQYNYAHPLIPFWNAAMLFAMFGTSATVLAAFRQAHLHLEETVALRTAALQREIEERKKAEQARLQSERLAMVGMMAAQVAHEVRNPLGAISLSLSLLAEEIQHLTAHSPHPPDELTELIETMRGEVQRINQVIVDYLSLAKPHQTQLEPIDLNDLLRQKLALMHSLFRESGITLTLHTAHDAFPLADRDRLWQAILNLLRNSIDAMPDGGHLLVETRLGKDGPQLAITDTGCGMTPAQKEKLFVPFSTSKAHGTGLGLALVQQIVTEHHAAIACHSEPDAGTTFTITFPVTRPEPLATPAASPAPSLLPS